MMMRWRVMRGMMVSSIQVTSVGWRCWTRGCCIRSWIGICSLTWVIVCSSQSWAKRSISWRGINAWTTSLSITWGERVDKLIWAHLLSWSWLTITCKVIRGNVTPRNFGIESERVIKSKTMMMILEIFVLSSLCCFLGKGILRQTDTHTIFLIAHYVSNAHWSEWWWS